MVEEKKYSDISYVKPVTLKDAEITLDQSLNQTRDLLARIPYFKGVPREDLIDAAKNLVEEVYIGLGSSQIISETEQEIRSKCAESCIKIMKHVGEDTYYAYNILKEEQAKMQEFFHEYENTAGAFNFFLDKEPAPGLKK